MLGTFLHTQLKLYTSIKHIYNTTFYTSIKHIYNTTFYTSIKHVYNTTFNIQLVLFTCLVSLSLTVYSQSQMALKYYMNFHTKGPFLWHAF